MIARRRLLSVSAVCAIALAACGTDGSESPGAAGGNQTLGHPPGGSHDSNPNEPTYPHDWLTTLERARNSTNFPFLLPHHAKANQENMTHVFLRPDRRAVMLDFPPQADANAAIRQRYVEIFLSPWTQGGNPDARLAESVATNPVQGRRIEYWDGRAVLIQEPQSTDDMEGENPAFIRFVMNGLDVQISGGTDVELLRDIAETMRRG